MPQHPRPTARGRNAAVRALTAAGRRHALGALAGVAEAAKIQPHRDPTLHNNPDLTVPTLSRSKMYPPWQVDCEDPQAWDRDPSVCGSCGTALARHPQHQPAPNPTSRDFVATYWSWMLRHGGVPNRFGYDDLAGAQILLHLTGECAPAPDLQEPSIGQLAEFAGTFADGNDSVDAVLGQLSCVCGEIERVTWAVKHDGLTVGEIIYGVLHHT